MVEVGVVVLLLGLGVSKRNPTSSVGKSFNVDSTKGEVAHQTAYLVEFVSPENVRVQSGLHGTVGNILKSINWGELGQQTSALTGVKEQTTWEAEESNTRRLIFGSDVAETYCIASMDAVVVLPTFDTTRPALVRQSAR